MVQLILGVGLVVMLGNNINRKNLLVEFATEPVRVGEGAIYAEETAPDMVFMVLSAVQDGTTVRTLHTVSGRGVSTPSSPLLKRQGEGPDRLSWHHVRTQRYGLRMIGESFRTATRHGWLLSAGFACFLVCILCCTWRWQFLLKAQGLCLPFRRVTALYFIGQFFSVFMPGATGGDLIKSYYAAMNAPGKRTEAVATVFIDRMIGLLALIAFSITIMLVRLPFFLAHPATRWALVFNGALLAATVAGLFVVFRKNLLEHWTFFRNMENRTPLGDILARVYAASRLCFGHPGLVTKTLMLSLLNHLLFTLAPYLLARAMEIDLSLGHCLTIFPIINAIAAVPLTPGGLGTRDGAAKYLLATVGIQATQALPLSLLVYATILFWGIIGGVVYVLFDKGGKPPAIAPAC